MTPLNRLSTPLLATVNAEPAVKVPPNQLITPPLVTLRAPVIETPLSVRLPRTKLVPARVTPPRFKFVIAPPWKEGSNIIVPETSCRLGTTLVRKVNVAPLHWKDPAPVKPTVGQIL